MLSAVAFSFYFNMRLVHAVISIVGLAFNKVLFYLNTGHHSERTNYLPKRTMSDPQDST